MISIIKKTSAWIPIALSFAMLAFIVFYLVKFGIVYHEDEGTPAYLFQIWLVLEFFMIAFFAINWLPHKPKQAIIILIIQIAAAMVACTPVFYFKM